MNRDKILEPQVVEGMIADGHIIVIFEDIILKLDSWLHQHPGGRLAILHMVGRDATDEIKAYVKSMLGLELIISNINPYPAGGTLRSLFRVPANWMTAEVSACFMSSMR
jgi:hypothetical protein